MKIIKIIILDISVFLCLVTLLSCNNKSKKDNIEKPNIIIILADDLGYNDLGCFGTQDPGIQTPNIDQLASEGMRFTDWQSANSVCSPSRGAILTGRYGPRSGQVVVPHPFDENQYKHLGLYQEELTIAEVLKPLGYATAALGKWHLGEHYDYRPLRHGFDQYYGEMHNIHTGQPGEIYRGDSSTNEFVRYEKIHKKLTHEAKVFMQKSKEEETPFFIYLSHYLVHGPWEPSKEFATEKEWKIRMQQNGGLHHKVYPAMVRELDWHVGEITTELERLEIAENTMIIFISDNGPWLTRDTIRSAGSAWPLRGSKFNTFEGGHRVPGIIKYPKKIHKGTVANQMVSSMDLLPTIAEIVGTSMSEDRVIDGKSIWPILQNKKDAESPHEILFAYQGKNLQTVRKGKWKLHLPRTPESVPFYAQKQWGRGTLDSISSPLLFNLDLDIGEQKNVSIANPEIVTELLEEAKKARKELGDWNMTGSNEHDYNGFEGDIHEIPIRTDKH